MRRRTPPPPDALDALAPHRPPERTLRIARGALLALLALCAVAFWIRTAHISASLPYPQHVDEVHIARSAANILTTGNYYPSYYPREFSKPSLPTYLAAAAMGVGFISIAPELGLERSFRQIDIRDDLGDVSYPFYTLPGVVEKARWLFALLSVVAMAAGGVVASHLLGRPGALILAPLVLALSSFFFGMSHSYLNVDIVGTCFVALGMAAVLQGTSRPCPTLCGLAVTPAICVGLAAGSKYTHGLLLLSVMLAIYLFMERGRRLQATVIAIMIAGLSFLAVAPYSVIALPDFVNGLARQAAHHTTGHPGFEADPGLDQLAYYASALISDFGVAGLVLCLIGLISAALSDWRRTLVLTSFPVALFALLSAQRVYFARSILPVFPLVAVFVTCGICFLHGQLMRVAWIRRIEVRRLQSAIGVVGFLGLFALGLNVPLGKFAMQMEVAGESRVRAVAWIKKHVAAHATVIVPEELHLDTRPLASSGYPIRIVEFKALDTAQSIDSLMAKIPGPMVVLVPRWVADIRFSDAESVKDRAAVLNEALVRAQLVPLADFSGPRTMPKGISQTRVDSLQRGVLINSPMSAYKGGIPGANPGFSIATSPDRVGNQGNLFSSTGYEYEGHWTGQRQHSPSATGVAGSPAEPLTAAFENVPAEHDGERAFRFRVAFSEDLIISHKTLRDESFTVTEGKVTEARRIDGRNDLWEITVEPDSREAVTITLPGGRACGTSGAVCTGGDAPKPLGNSPSTTVVAGSSAEPL